MNQLIILVGNVGRDPEMRFTPSGQAVTTFSMATTHQYTSNGEKVKETTWFRVNVWGKSAEAVHQYVTKGAKVYVEGRLVSDKATGGPKVWTKQDGTPSASFDVTASTVKFLDSAKVGQNEQAAQVDESEFPF